MDPSTTLPAQDIPYTAHQAPVAWPHRIRSRRPLLIAVAVIVVALAAGFMVLRANNVGPLKDSGLTACEAFRDGAFSDDNGDADAVTEAEYRETRKAFADSRYDDIRDSGTKLVDLAWQVGQAGRSNTDAGAQFGMALAMFGQLTQSYSALSGACANHGVTLPPFMQN